jgi:hypothetical protein
MGGRVSEWEAKAMRRHDEMQAKIARIQSEAEQAHKRRAAEIRQAEHSRQWDRQREDIHPAEVLERLTSLESTKPAPTILPPAVPDTDSDRPVRTLGHTSEEVREILATLETAYRELFPQLNLRQWAGSIYTWLTQPVLDPTNSGRVTMDYLMKLVTTALEWSYEAKATDVKVDMLEKAASLLVLRRDTLRIIDGAGPSVEAFPSETTGQEQARGTGSEQVSSPNAQPEKPTSASTELVNQARSPKEAAMQPPTSVKCTFSGVVPIDLKRFLESGVVLVECPDCAATRTLEPHGGVLRAVVS